MIRFCNPLVLLHLENMPLADLTPERIRAAEQHLLAALEINGQQTVPYHGHPLPETTVLAAIELLERPAFLQFFQRLLQEPDLHNFLHGSWSVSFGAIANSSLWHHPVLRDPLKIYMQPALSAALVQALQLRQQRRVLEIVTLVEATPILEATVCYDPAQTWLEAQVTMLNTLVLEEGTPDYPQKSRAVRKDLLDGKAYEARTLNSLPEYVFRPRIGELGLCLTDLARRAFPAEPLFAVKMFSTARLLDVDQALHARIESVYTSTAGKWEPPIQEVEPVLPPPPPRPRPPAPKPRLQPQPAPKPTQSPFLKKWKSLKPDHRLLIKLFTLGFIYIFIYCLLPGKSDKLDPSVSNEQPVTQSRNRWEPVQSPPHERSAQERKQRVAYWDSVRVANDRPAPPEIVTEIVEDKPTSPKLPTTNSALAIDFSTLQRPFSNCLPTQSLSEKPYNSIPLYGDAQWDAVVFLYRNLGLYDHFYLPRGKMTKFLYPSGGFTVLVIFGKNWSPDLKNPCNSNGYFSTVGKCYESSNKNSGVLTLDNYEYSIKLDHTGAGNWLPRSDQQVFKRIKRYN